MPLFNGFWTQSEKRFDNDHDQEFAFENQLSARVQTGSESMESGVEGDQSDDDYDPGASADPVPSKAKRYPQAFVNLFGRQVLKDGSRARKTSWAKVKDPDVQAPVRGSSSALRCLDGEVLTTPRARRPVGERALIPTC